MSRKARSHNSVQSQNQVQRRETGLLLFIFLLAALVIARLVLLQIVWAPDLSEKAAGQHMVDVTVSAKRGTIYDRNGEVIAANILASTIYVNPKEVEKPAELAQALYDVLGKQYDVDYSTYYERVTMSDCSFAYIQRKATTKIAKKLKKRLEAEDLKGIHYLTDTKRIYPNGEVGSQIIGTSDIDGKGIAGLEMQYDDLLKGVDGEEMVEQGFAGLPISNGAITKTEAIDGSDITTSVDIKLQSKVEKSLKAAIKKYSGKGGTATVMDAKTGEIYASASYAKNDSGKLALEVGKLGSVTDAYEPGSTFKAITAASILKNSKVTTSTTFTVPGSLTVYDHKIKDSHDHDTQTMSFKDIIAESSNIGTVLASRKVSAKNLYKTYTKFGFGKTPATDFPGTAAGILSDYKSWVPIQQANITFGQGIMVTGAQLISSYCAIEQGGVQCVPHFLTNIPSSSEKAKEYMSKLIATKKVADKKTCSEITKMLRAVVTSGTGQDADISGFKVVGKTGTAEVANNTGGYGDGYIVSFCGWLEGSSSDLVCLVTVDHPKSEEGGGPICGPVFADIMSFVVDRYQVVPEAN